MKGKIDRDGFLWIERAGKMNETTCPYSQWLNKTTEEPISCGDWCPLFGEPILKALRLFNNDVVNKMTIELCRKDIIFDELTDERSK